MNTIGTLTQGISKGRTSESTMSRATYYVQIVRSDGRGEKHTVMKKLRTHGSSWQLHNRTDRVSHELFEELSRELTPEAIDHVLELLKQKVPCTAEW